MNSKSSQPKRAGYREKHHEHHLILTLIFKILQGKPLDQVCNSHTQEKSYSYSIVPISVPSPRLLQNEKSHDSVKGTKFQSDKMENDTAKQFRSYFAELKLEIGFKLPIRLFWEF